MISYAELQPHDPVNSQIIVTIFNTVEGSRKTNFIPTALRYVNYDEKNWDLPIKQIFMIQNFKVYLIYYCS